MGAIAFGFVAFGESIKITQAVKLIANRRLVEPLTGTIHTGHAVVAIFAALFAHVATFIGTDFIDTAFAA